MAIEVEELDQRSWRWDDGWHWRCLLSLCLLTFKQTRQIEQLLALSHSEVLFELNI